MGDIRLRAMKFQSEFHRRGANQVLLQSSLLHDVQVEEIEAEAPSTVHVVNIEGITLVQHGNA